MKAAVHSKYGLPGDLSVKEIDIPTPKENEVLIRVHATTVNRSDCHVLSGKPYVMRLFTGLFKPRKSIAGSDFAGEIAATGSAAQSFKVGEKIMGFGGGFGCGSHAQYFTMAEGRGIITMAANLNYDEAAACLEGAFYAAANIIGLKLTAGQKALVYGATGAIGSSYVQFLKYYGVYVTAVCGGEHEELVKSLGATRIIDYKKENFTRDKEQYDYVFDAIGKSTFAKCKRLLKKNGSYFPSNGFENLFLVPLTRLLGGKKVAFISLIRINEGLNFIKRMIEQGHFRPVIDRKYPLEKIAEAFIYVASGQKIGNVIIKMDD